MAPKGAFDSTLKCHPPGCYHGSHLRGSAIIGRWPGLRGGTRTLRAAVLACCAAAGLAGCASGTSSSQSTVLPDRTVSAPASTAAAGDPQALARQAYLGMWQAFFTASQTADYQSPSLDHYAAGSALELLIHGLYQNYREGIVTRVSELCREGVAGPGVVGDLSGWGLTWPYGRKPGGEELAAEPGEHVGGAGLGLGGVPRA